MSTECPASASLYAKLFASVSEPPSLTPARKWTIAIFIVSPVNRTEFFYRFGRSHADEFVFAHVAQKFLPPNEHFRIDVKLPVMVRHHEYFGTVKFFACVIEAFFHVPERREKIGLHAAEFLARPVFYKAVVTIEELFPCVVQAVFHERYGIKHIFERPYNVPEYLHAVAVNDVPRSL